MYRIEKAKLFFYNVFKENLWLFLKITKLGF